MEQINKLIVLLMTIQNFAKDIHYNCKGESFYSKHILCDRISKDISNYIDSIKELFFLAADEEPLSSKEYLKGASELVPIISSEDDKSFKALAVLLVNTLQHIEGFKDLTKGEDNLIGAIAENLQVSLGLVNRQIKS